MALGTPSMRSHYILGNATEVRCHKSVGTSSSGQGDFPQHPRSRRGRGAAHYVSGFEQAPGRVEPPVPR